MTFPILTANALGPISISDKTSYHKISWSLKSRRYRITLKFLQAFRELCYRGAYQISERSYHSKYKSRGIDTSRDLTIRHLPVYWNGALMSKHAITQNVLFKCSNPKRWNVSVQFYCSWVPRTSIKNLNNRKFSRVYASLFDLSTGDHLMVSVAGWRTMTIRRMCSKWTISTLGTCAVMLLLQLPVSSACGRGAIYLKDNQYRQMLVAISEAVPEDQRLIDRIKEVFREASLTLFEATR